MGIRQVGGVRWELVGDGGGVSGEDVSARGLGGVLGCRGKHVAFAATEKRCEQCWVAKILVTASLCRPLLKGRSAETSGISSNVEDITRGTIWEWWGGVG